MSKTKRNARSMWRLKFLEHRRKMIRESLQESGVGEEEIKRVVHESHHHLKVGFDEGMRCADANPREVKSPWKPADGDDLPPFDKDVIVLIQEHPWEEFEVCFANRQKPTITIETSCGTKVINVATFGKNNWNKPNVKFWLDADIMPEWKE